MELQIIQCWHLLSQVFEGADHIESVQCAFEGQVCIDSIQRLHPGIQNVEAFSPCQLAHSIGKGRQFF